MATDAPQDKPAISPAAQGINFMDVIRAAALGISPQAPRLPEQLLSGTQQFGGYQKGFTSRMGFRGALSFSMLRQIGARSMLMSAIRSTRKHQKARYARVAQRSTRGEVGFRCVHARSKEPGFKVPEGYHKLCRQAEAMMMKPWRVYWSEGVVFRQVEPTLSGFISKVTDDTLILNRPAIELGLDSARVPRAFGAIDGANVIPTFQALKYLTAVNRGMPKDYQDNWVAFRHTMQLLSDRFKISIDERTEYIYMLNGKPAAGFRGDEIIVPEFLPTSDVQDVGYSRSLTEQAIFAITAEIMAMSANSRYFEFGSMAEVILLLKGNYKDEHIQDFQKLMQGNMSGVPGMFRTPVLATPGGKDDANVLQLKQNHRDMLFDIYIQKLTNLVCAIFRMHPSEINEAPRAGDNAGAMTLPSQTKQIAMSQEQGLETSLEFDKSHIFDPILERVDPHLRMEWEYGRQEAEQLEVVTKYGPITTVNERRVMMGLEELEGEEGETIDNQFIQANKQMEAQADLQKDQLKSQEKMGKQQLDAQGQQQAAEAQQRSTDKEPDNQMASRVAARQSGGGSAGPARSK